MSKRVKRGRCKTTSLSIVKIIDFEIIKILETINTVKHVKNSHLRMKTNWRTGHRCAVTGH